MGLDEQEFRDFAVQLVAGHVGEVHDETVSTSKSSNGKYLSVTVTIEAESQQQLDSIYRDLTAHERVKVAL